MPELTLQAAISSMRMLTNPDALSRVTLEEVSEAQRQTYQVLRELEASRRKKEADANRISN